MLTSCICRQQFCEDPIFTQWHPLFPWNPKYNRKVWEYSFICQVLKERGKLVPDSHGFGFGVGKEPLPAIFVNHGCNILASDIGPGEVADMWDESWAHANGVGELVNGGICNEDDFKRRVDFMNVDMNDLPDVVGVNGKFDFIWSCSALDHLGTLDNAKRFIRKSLQYLNEDGIVVHTTEYNLGLTSTNLEQGPVVAFRRHDLQWLFEELADDGWSVVMDWTLGTDEMDLHVAGFEDYKNPDLPYLVVNIGGCVLTSVGIVIEKDKNYENQTF